MENHSNVTTVNTADTDGGLLKIEFIQNVIKVNGIHDSLLRRKPLSLIAQRSSLVSQTPVLGVLKMKLDVNYKKLLKFYII